MHVYDYLYVEFRKIIAEAPEYVNIPIKKHNGIDLFESNVKFCGVQGAQNNTPEDFVPISPRYLGKDVFREKSTLSFMDQDEDLMLVILIY